MEVESNKVICTEFGRNILDGYIDDHDELSIVDHSMNLPPRHLQDLPCLIIFLLCLEFIIRLIESAFPSLILTNLDPILCK